MVFLFAMLWGTASTVMGAPARKSFSEFFRNLVDGLLKGHAKPASFKLVRTNLMAVRKNYLIYFLCGSPFIELWYHKQWINWTFFLKDTGSVFDYTLDPTKPGLWCSWADQSSNEKIEAENEEEGSMIVPTSETVKQSFFLKIALELGIPLGI